MGMSAAPFGQQYGQPGVQQMGPVGVNGQQLPNKTALPNNLAPFPAELKGPGTVPNMVSVCLKYEKKVGTTLSYAFHDLRVTCLNMHLCSFHIFDQFLIFLLCFLWNPDTKALLHLICTRKILLQTNNILEYHPHPSESQ